MSTLLFWISKLVNPILSPLTLAILIPAAALTVSILVPTLRSSSRYRVSATVALALLGGLYLVSLPAVSNLLVRAWETERTDPESIGESPLAPFDAIIVLGGSVTVETSEGWHIETGQTMERITDAARLYRRLAGEGTPPRVIVSGGSGNPAYRDRSEAPLMLELLNLMGVPSDAVIMESESRNTYENALFTKQIMDREGLKAAILVTSALHMRRSRAIFARQGFRFFPFTVDTSLYRVPFPNSVFPDTYALDNSYRTVREIVGFAVYRAMGRL